MRLVIRVLGCEVFAVEFGWPTEQEAEEEQQCDEAQSAWHGQSEVAAHMERDPNPLSPDDRYDWEWEEDRKKKFGFDTGQ